VRSVGALVAQRIPEFDLGVAGSRSMVRRRPVSTNP
jgi:hypothetical protein